MCDVMSTTRRATMTRRTVLASTAALGIASAGTAVAAGAQPARRADRYRTKVVLLGTAGGPAWLEESPRAGIATALAVGDRYYLIDAGEGVGTRIQAAGIGSPGVNLGPLDKLSGIFLTHLHSDHVVDLNNILSFGPFNGLDLNDRKVPIWGPGDRGELPPLFGPPPEPPVVAPDNPTPGTRDMVDLLVRAFATDFNDRVRDNRRPVPADLFEGHDVPIPEQYLDDPNGDPHPRMSPVTFFEDDHVRVSATLVQHAPVFPALAYRIDSDDGSAVFSGDTGTSENLVELATGADVLVHEVISRQYVEEQFPPPRTEIEEALVTHLLTSHTAIEDVGPLAERAGVGTLVLSHLVPASLPDHHWRQAQRGFSGHLVVGNDLDQIGVGRR